MGWGVCAGRDKVTGFSIAYQNATVAKWEPVGKGTASRRPVPGLKGNGYKRVRLEYRRS